MSVARGAPNAGHFYSNIVSPIKVDCQFVVNAADSGGLGITSLKSNGYVQNIYMHTSATPATGNPNPIAGYALVHLKQNFNHFLGIDHVVQPPVTGSAINISDGSVLTLGTPYQIVTVGTVPAETFDIVTVADISKSLAGLYFTASDGFGNNFVFYNVVSGSGTPPALTGALANYTAVPVTFASGAADSAVASGVSTAVAGVNGGNSFSTSVSSHTVTVTSKVANLVLTPPANAQTSTFTINNVVFTSLTAGWHSVGLPSGLTPTVGQVFIATATGGAVGSGTVKALAASSVGSVAVLGVSDASIATSSIAQYQGAYVYLRFLNGSLAATNPTDGAIVSLSLYFDQSSVTVDGL